MNVPWSFISISRILITDSNIWQEAMAFPYPLPEFLAKMMPSRLGTMLVALFLLNLLLAVFPAHRVWLMLSGREKGVPAAYNGLAQWLGMAGAFFHCGFCSGNHCDHRFAGRLWRASRHAADSHALFGAHEFCADGNQEFHAAPGGKAPQGARHAPRKIMAGNDFQDAPLNAREDKAPSPPQAGGIASKERANPGYLKSCPPHIPLGRIAMNQGAKKRLAGLQRERAA